MNILLFGLTMIMASLLFLARFIIIMNTGMSKALYPSIFIFKERYCAFAKEQLACGIKSCSIYCIGQRMSNKCAKIKSNLQNAMLLDLPSKTQKTVEVAIERYSKSAPIRPMDMFNLNVANGASLAGFMLAYLLVLYSFKFGDNFLDKDKI